MGPLHASFVAKKAGLWHTRPQVMQMDKEQTGALIADTRKEKNWTQKELARELHVSDRAVSKWERGAGFPDVSLLEPLATALGLTVLDLLRGERTEETDVHAAVREALDAFQEKRRQTRRYVWGELGRVCLFLLVAGFLLSWMFPFKEAVDTTVTAGIYQNGVLIAYTDVEIQGTIEYHLPTGRRGYWGRFAIDCVEWTTREQANAGISLKGESGLGYTMSGISTHALYDISTVISPDMMDFAFALQSPYIHHQNQPPAEDWYVLATSPEMYETYWAQTGNGPPALQAPHPERLPEFPSAWKTW